MIVAEDFGALVALRAKQGELTARREWDQTQQIRLVQPLLELDPNKSSKQLDDVEKVARKLHEHNRHLMIDASEVEHLPNFGVGPIGALDSLADRLETPEQLFGAYRVPFKPVIRCGASSDVLLACRNLFEELELGGAIRMRPAETTAPQLRKLVEELRLDRTGLDLIIDLQYVPEIPPRFAERTADVLRTVASLGPFRSTTLLCGSIPRLLDRTSTWEEPRVEEELWRLVRDDAGVDLRLGDYGVVHPIPGTGYRSKHVTLKYSRDDHWVYSREPTEQTADDAVDESARASTLRAICCELVHSKRFAGAEFSWGDAEISTALDNTASAWGASSRPVALGTSHHLAHLTTRTAA